ncbi:hypothetical protein SERLA73DRAFT_70694 [Serpula lacrymans var. lacrymans S7.3]|uniref:Uncharacterized protein n=1 Tax=Serpula lacrymans var. lacrymans (strain S7.3) TaxID=936435 RepID=F8PQ49_SERL3|nr:hypothetical protein SERLA73DRAFT_70694 [Serpula lacrymans var. lacrymans S7.3]
MTFEHLSSALGVSSLPSHPIVTTPFAEESLANVSSPSSSLSTVTATLEQPTNNTSATLSPSTASSSNSTQPITTAMTDGRLVTDHPQSSPFSSPTPSSFSSQSSVSQSVSTSYGLGSIDSPLQTKHPSLPSPIVSSATTSENATSTSDPLLRTDHPSTSVAESPTVTQGTATYAESWTSSSPGTPATTGVSTSSSETSPFAHHGAPPNPCAEPSPPPFTNTPATNSETISANASVGESSPTQSSSPGPSGTATTGSLSQTGHGSQPPSSPQRIVAVSSTLMTMTTKTTVSGHTYETTMTVESIGAGHPTPSSSASNQPGIGTETSATSSNHLPIILGTVLSAVGVLIFCVVLCRIRIRRRGGHFRPRSLSFLQAPPATIPQVQSSLASTESSSDYSEPMTQISGHEPIIDPFADPPDPRYPSTADAPSLYSTDTLVSQIPFVTDVQLSELESSSSGGSSSLIFARPVSSRASSAQSHYFSSTGHYDIGPSPEKSFEKPKVKDNKNTSDRTQFAESGSGTSPISTLYGTRLRALLDEARSR